MVLSTITIGAVRDEAVQSRLDDPGDLGGRRGQDRATLRHRDDRVDLEVADRDPERVELAEHADARRERVERDLLGRLAQRGRGDVRIVRLGGSTREADLAAVVAVAGRALGQDDPGDAVVVRVDQDEHARRAPAASRGRGLGRPALHPADDDRHQDVGRSRQWVGQRRQALEDDVEPHAWRPAG